MATYPVPEFVNIINAPPKISGVELYEDDENNKDYVLVRPDTVQVDDEIVMVKILFDRSGLNLRFTIGNDCCEQNWFSFASDPNRALVGRSVVNLFEGEARDPPVPFGKDESEIQYTISIILDGHGRYDFYRNNASNGYYSGSLQIKLYNDDTPVTA